MIIPTDELNFLQRARFFSGVIRHWLMINSHSRLEWMILAFISWTIFHYNNNHQLYIITYIYSIYIYIYSIYIYIQLLVDDSYTTLPIGGWLWYTMLSQAPAAKAVSNNAGVDNFGLGLLLQSRRVEKGLW